ncbi:MULTISPECIES: bifunctional class I SAM-dependent methyltransferase/N-acetyltransferase [unclassified Streptomyces]|uniref:bifunctional class I SAM-dependent methyltransferase/N-acetyltransferase n=1 Tax=unclassified Streptomyces TaxID=2593676 RepID=UPI002256D02E|nr:MULTISPECIES: bifunctional class I SAM-dependent methyltransferase/N-acetyltransferase [unclassified Streptomyces]MCX4529005.1 bifunctional class I SAM-dependent methyltransferase/N-acetyltransferase [Streptomyces sp. NBC_01551]MCX4540312.1 bifunctional class I SAM-dependent methyltransferase/N-acetyltransferase [Streptomyces sp. NBC_01565]
MTDTTRSSDFSRDAFAEAFFTLHHGLPRQAPGSDATTRHLLSLCGPLPERPRVLDLGCGPGRSALLLAEEAGPAGAGAAWVTAVDLHGPFLDELRAAAEARGVADRVRPVNADMGALACADGSFDLVWAEGSAYSIGFDTALTRWKRLLAPGGTLVLTECEWTAARPSAGARAFWDTHYPLRSTARNLAAAQAAGYRVLGVFHQPDSDWAEYYGPLAERARAHSADGAGEGAGVAPGDGAPAMAAALAATREELDVRARHGHEYGYTGYVLRPVTAGDGAAWPARPETAADVAAVRDVNLAAFETPLEADLVDALRADASWLPGLSYVAEAPDGSVAAHALLTRCEVDGVPALALAPVAADPALQRTGAGSSVVRALLAAAKERGESLVLVLGHPSYYPRFGFVPASRFGIRAPFEVPDEAMMALVLDDSVPVPAGTIGYPAPFGI